MFVYDPEGDTWEPRAAMSEAKCISGAAVVNEKIVVIKGVDARQNRESKVFVYEPLTDHWYDLGELPGNFMLAGVASIANWVTIQNQSLHSD